LVRLAVASAVLHGQGVEGLRRSSRAVRAEEEDSAKGPSGTWPPPPEYPRCHLGSSSCSIRDMTEDTLVMTDSPNSRCFNGDPWGFLVHPGDTDKFLFYFPGGGACFSSPNFFLPDLELCAANMSLGLLATGFGYGITDFNDDRNVFSSYTVIAPTYCDGSAHAGNSTKSSKNGDRYQFGYNNVQFAKNWALANLDKSLSSFVMLGTSAGSLGVAMWSDTLLSTFSYKKAAVIMDSYTAVFPWNTPGPLVKDFGLCSTPLAGPFTDKCKEGTFDFPELVDYSMKQHPNVAFSHLNAKADEVQVYFFKAIALAYSKNPLLSSSQYYFWSNLIMEYYNRNPNYVTYVVEGAFHTYIAFDSYYTTSTLGEEEPTAPQGTPLMYEWVRKLVNHESVKSECAGPAVPNGAWNASYCDQELYPKRLSV